MKIVLLVLPVLMFINSLLAQPGSVIPKPLSMEMQKGAAFLINTDVAFVADDRLNNEASQLTSLIKRYTGHQLNIQSRKPASKNTRIISLNLSADTLRFPVEAYSIDVAGNSATVTASSAAGIYYGAITLLQLIQKDAAGAYSLPAVRISDKPRFAWRGLMLDCSRTFISPGHIMRTIDRMSFYKLNTLHLHLTDDQGWRLQIKKRPLLTTRGAYFADNYHEPEAFEGFYTQEQMKEIIAYAADRHVTIVPEIEAPGHSSAAIFSYPELSCSGRSVPIFPLLAGSPAPPNDVFCAGNEDTYQFFKDVLEEVVDLFPSPVVHLGGDEVSRHHWRQCEKCKNKMKAENIDNEGRLQGYFMNRISKTVTKSGKRPIGWDEVTDGSLDSNWIVMAWQEEGKGIEAARQGYDVVLTPTSHLYFDYRYITTPTKKVYEYEPVPDSLQSEFAKHVLGIQANFWSHIERTESRIDFMIFPRALALAERAWSHKSVKDYKDFKKRKEDHTSWLRFFDIKYNGNDDPERSPWDLVW